MRIRKVTIQKLFGLFSHEIPFNVDDRITIIHGPNGVGKTTVLKLIGDLFELRLSSLYSTPYSILVITFEDGRVLKVKRTISTRKREDTTLEFTLLNFKGRRPRKQTLESSPDWHNDRSPFPLHMLEDSIPHLNRVGRREWIDGRDNQVLSLREVFDRYSDFLPEQSRLQYSHVAKWLREILEALPTHFIQTQRLFVVPPTQAHQYRPKRPETKATVEQYSEEMVHVIQDALRQSGARGASLDRTFPHRLMKQGVPKTATQRFIRNKYEEQTKYRKRLMDAGLIEAEDEVALPKRTLKPNERKVLWYYLSDVDQKFSVLDDLLKKVELFREIINTRFLFKKFSVDKTEGFVFETEHSKRVPLTALSSGEQHELVLSYQLLFKTREKSLILIDEPELSLHVTWQHKFLGDIGRISKLADLDFLIATHSPSIVRDRRDLMVDLVKE